jgi:hypothetical protein
MKRRDGICLWAPAAILIAVLVLVRVGAAQDETQTPREAVEQKQPTKISGFTIYPVPNYAGILGCGLISREIGAGSGQSWRIEMCSLNSI